VTTVTPDLAPDTMPAIAELPLTSVWINGDELNAAALRTLGPVRIRQEVSAPAVCELELDLTSDLVRPERAMAVRVRIEGASDDVFTGEIVSVGHHFGPDGIHRVRLRCFDTSHRLRQTSAVTAHTDVTVAGIAHTFARRHGLGVAAQRGGPLWPRIIQQGESDCELLSRLAADAGLWWQLDGDQILIQRWAVTDTHEATWGVDLYEAIVDSDGTAAATSVRTLGWDPIERKIIDAQAGSSDAGGSSGVGDLLGGSGDLLLADRLVPTSDHAEGLAQGELDFRTGGVDTIRAVVKGDLRWRPGVGLKIADQPDDLAGPYLLTSVEHVVDPFSGYVCVVSSRPVPRAPRRSTGVPASGLAAFTMAEVIDVDDPARAGRVKIKFMTLDDVESEWLPVISLGAGEDKGLLCQPDKGDTVLVLHAADDPGRGVVLGGLFADHLPGDAAGVSGAAVRRFGWNTPDGQRMLLNRDGDQVVISNNAGTRIEISSDAMLIHSAVDLTIEAPGRRLVIKADTVDFERA
jgi:phage baseplate assembly protein gpV/phage protein D